jgi:hypothetical protein
MKTDELERAAYAAGDIQTAKLLGSVIDLEDERNTLQNTLEDIPSEAERNRDAHDLEMLKEFFYECFRRLNGHYPCPEWSSDYDKSVIYDAIEKGEQ